MDEFNNKNPFDEENTSENGNGYDPYNQPKQDPNPYGQPQQNSNPYNQPQNSVPYNMPQQNANPYGQPQQNQNPYNQPYQQPYNQQSGVYNQVNSPQQGYSYPQYGGTPYQPYTPQNQSTGMAVASLVLGIISICTGLFMFSFPILFIMPIVGLILGIVFKTKRLPVGKGMSTAGIITSALGLILPIILLVIMVVILLTNGAEIMNYIKEYSPEQYKELYDLYKDDFPQWFEGTFRFFGFFK